MINVEVTKVPILIKGGKFEDNRGVLSYVNDFIMNDIKRFYVMEHPNCEIIRAWHGHKYEKKYFYVLKGSFLINSVLIDDWAHPSEDLVPFSNVLSSDSSNILCVPNGYANGLKALENNSSLIVFSNFNLQDSLDDDYRFDYKLWYDWNKKI